jgi:tRNA threonylcarbamoyladenosine biosynthesis protein TsaE
MREPSSVHLILADAAATRRLGAALAQALSVDVAESVVVFLEGELGAGKTTLVSGLLAQLGFVGSVRSPTYTLLEPYDVGHRSLTHVDLYRLSDPAEVDGLGLRDLLEQGSALLIEWPSQGTGHLPEPDLVIRLAYESTGDRRAATIDGPTAKGRKLLAAFIGVTEQ